MLRLVTSGQDVVRWCFVSARRLLSEVLVELVPMSVVAWRRRTTMVSDNNLLLPPPYTEISRSANTNISQTLESVETGDWRVEILSCLPVDREALSRL